MLAQLIHPVLTILIVLGTSTGSARVYPGLVGTALSSGPGNALEMGVHTSTNEVQTKADIDAYDQERVHLIGVYRQYALQKGPQAGGKKKHFRGHVYIELQDGEGVILLPVWDKNSMRDRKEIKRYQGKRVRLTGVIHKVAPNRPDPVPVQNLMVPCLTDLESIELARE